MFKAIRSILNHSLSRQEIPKAISRYVEWQVGSRLGNPEQVKPWINGLRLIVKRGFHASTACYYFGLPEFDSMGFLLHFLRPGDLFVDVGANIGAYSLLSAGVCGANSMAFEPSLSSTVVMERNIAINQLKSRVALHKIGLGKENNTAALTTEKGIQNHIVQQSEMGNTQAILLAPLDDFCQHDIPLLIKIDVEGFETEVVNGAAKTLENPDLKAVIIEQVGLGERFGHDEDVLHQRFLSMGFQQFGYEPFTKQLSSNAKTISGNKLYIRELDFVKNRIASASVVSVHGHPI